MGTREGLDHSSIVQQATSSKGDNAHVKFEDEFEGGWNNAEQGVDDPSHDAHVFAGGHGKAARLEGVERGQSGFGNRLWGASTMEAVEHANEWGVIATPVTPVLKPCEDGIAEQAAAVKELSKTDGDPDWVSRGKAYSKAWAGENQQATMRYDVDQNLQCTAFNAWVPIANASHAAMAEMVEAARLMGFDPSKDKDAVAFIKAIEASLEMATELVDAPLLGSSGKTSWSNRTDDSSAQSRAQPQLSGTEVGPEVRSLGESYRNLREAYLGIYRALLLEKKKLVDKQVEETQSKITDINNVIAFWTQMGGVADAAISHTNAGIRLEHRVSRSIGSGKYKGAGMRRAAEKQAQHAEAHPSDYESEIDAHAKADDYENYEDNWGHGKASIEANGPQVPEVPAPDELPSLSISGLISVGMKLWSKGKLQELNSQLASLQMSSGSYAATIDLTGTMEAKRIYTDAGLAFEQRLAAMGDHSLAVRQQDFMDTGAQLDAYALEHQSGLNAQGKAGLAPGGGHEIYATMMAVMGKVEQYRTLSALALGTFDYDGFSNVIKNQQVERAGVKRPAESAARNPNLAYHRPPDVRPMSAEELAVYQQIGGTYLMVSQQDAHWGVRLAGVVPRFKTLMQHLAGHGKQGVGKKY